MVRRTTELSVTGKEKVYVYSMLQNPLFAESSLLTFVKMFKHCHLLKEIQRAAVLATAKKECQ